MTKKVFFHLDDNRIALKIFERISLEIADVISAKNFEESEEIIKFQPDINCFIIDYSLQSENGLLFIQKLRTINKYEETPVILYTSTLTNEIEYEAMKAGVNESVSKKILPEDLLKIILKQVEKPYTKLVIKKYQEATCIKWENNNEFFQYCPVFNIQVKAENSENAEHKMKILIKNHLKNYPAGFQGIIPIKTVLHRFKFDDFEK